MQLSLLVDALNNYLAISLFNDYGPNGLQVEGRPEVKRIATAVTASAYAIEEAVKRGCDALLVHHGLFWQKDPYPIIGPKRKRLELLLQNQLSLLAYHLPLDAHQEVGNNWVAARALGWTDLKPFFGYGVQGVIAPCSVEYLSEKLEKYYNHCAHKALGGPKQVHHCALISGGAYRCLPEAAQAGVDTFITGNFDEPAWHLAHEHKVNFFALGHAATEKIGPKALVPLLQDQWGMEAFFIDEENPF